MQRKLFFKPCPFCGADEDSIVIRHNASKNGRFYYVECEICGSRTRGLCRQWNEIKAAGDETFEDEWENEQAIRVIKLWNQRSGANAKQDH